MSVVKWIVFRDDADCPHETTSFQIHETILPHYSIMRTKNMATRPEKIPCMSLICRISASRIPLPAAIDTDCPMTESPPKETMVAIRTVLNARLALQRLIMFAPTVISSIPFRKETVSSLPRCVQIPAASARSMPIIKIIRYAKITAMALKPDVIEIVKLSKTEDTAA